MKHTNVIFDLSNIAWIARHANLNKDEPFTRELLMYSVLNMIKFISLDYKATGILIACDASNGWRYDIYPQYKAQRDESRDEFYDEVKSVMNDLMIFFNTCTSIPAVKVARAEADDIIGVASKISPHDTVIVSSDKDFIQLIDHKTKLYSPPLRAERTTSDRDYELFLKCIRGDTGDNIHSAYPRVRETFLVKAWNDKNEMVNLMETKRKIDGVRVGDAYKLNRSLIDLNLIPKYIETNIIVELNKASIGEGYSSYSQLKTLQFLGQNNLKKIADELSVYNNLFKKRFCL